MDNRMGDTETRRMSHAARRPSGVTRNKPVASRRRFSEAGTDVTPVDEDIARRWLACFLFGEETVVTASQLTALAALVFEADTADEFAPTGAAAINTLAKLENMAREMLALLMSEVVRIAAPNLAAQAGVEDVSSDAACAPTLADTADQQRANTWLRRLEAAARARRLALQQKMPARRTGNRRVPGLLGSPTGRLMCAIAVAEAVYARKGKRPHENNSDVLQACAILWSLAAGPVNGHSADPAANWRRYIVLASDRAQKPRVAVLSARQMVQRALRVCAQGLRLATPKKSGEIEGT